MWMVKPMWEKIPIKYGVSNFFASGDNFLRKWERAKDFYSLTNIFTSSASEIMLRNLISIICQAVFLKGQC